MAGIKDQASSVYRDFAVDGVPASGQNDPKKADIRGLFSIIDVAVAAAQAGLTTVATIADRDAFYATPANRSKLVYVNNNNGSATDPANGVYEYVGSAPRIAESFYEGVSVVVQPLVDEATAAADLAEASAAEVATTIRKNTRADTLLQVSDDSRTLDVVAGDGALSAGVVPAWIAGLSDSVIFDLLTVGAASWRGEWRPDDVYSRGHLVRVGVLTFALCYLDISRSMVSPRDDVDHWSIIELVPRQRSVAKDNFTTNPGPAKGRPVAGSDGLAFDVGGQAQVDGTVIVANGYMTANKNAYYFINNLPAGLSEFLVRTRLTAPIGLVTMAISPIANFSAEPNFGSMIHVNITQSELDQTTYWDKETGAAGLPLVYKYRWRRSGGALLQAIPQEYTLKIRGSFIFGYVDGLLSFVMLSDMIGKLAGNGRARGIFIQNHDQTTGGSSGALGNERQEMLALKVED